MCRRTLHWYLSKCVACVSGKVVGVNGKKESLCFYFLGNFWCVEERKVFCGELGRSINNREGEWDTMACCLLLGAV